MLPVAFFQSQPGRASGNKNISSSNDHYHSLPDEEDTCSLNIELQETPSNEEDDAVRNTAPSDEYRIWQYHKQVLDERRPRTRRQVFALALGILPVFLFGLEMIPNHCRYLCQVVERDAYFFAVALCGGVAAVLYGENSMEYAFAKLVGGMMASLGSLFTIWMILQSLPGGGAWVSFAIFLPVGILGAMPGFLIYWLLKILTDECFVSDWSDFDELAPLTKIRIVSAED